MGGEVRVAQIGGYSCGWRVDRPSYPRRADRTPVDGRTFGSLLCLARQRNVEVLDPGYFSEERA